MVGLKASLCPWPYWSHSPEGVSSEEGDVEGLLFRELLERYEDGVTEPDVSHKLQGDQAVPSWRLVRVQHLCLIKELSPKRKKVNKLTGWALTHIKSTIPTIQGWKQESGMSLPRDTVFPFAFWEIRGKTDHNKGETLPGSNYFSWSSN